MNEKQMAETITDLLGPVGGRILRVFECMEIAEEEIAAAIERYPVLGVAINAAFKHLYPTRALDGARDEVYRAHCRELLERVADGEDVRPGTKAEVMMTLSRLSQHAHLTEAAGALYRELFDELFPGEMSWEPGVLSEPYPGATEEALLTARRKLMNNERGTQ